MINRRNFVRGAALATALAQTLPARAKRVGDLPWVLVDARHVESRLFAASLERRGAKVLSLADGDVTQVWREELSQAWSRGPITLAGLTRPDALFVLEHLAWGHGLRVVLHAEHLIGAGSPHHQILGCARGAAVPGIRELGLLGPAWPAAVATAVADLRGHRDAAPAGPSCSGLAPEAPAGSSLLASWVIAPVRTSRS
jgi:hypothetical protein